MRSGQSVLLFICTFLLLTTPSPSSTFAQQATPTEATTIYTVAPGDTLFTIAQRFDTTVQELMRINELSDPNLVYVGQQLRLTDDGAEQGGSANSLTGATAIPAGGLDSNLPDAAFGYGMEAFFADQNPGAVTSLIDALGVNWVKFSVDWRVYEPTQGDIDFETLDTIVQALELRDLSILMTITTSPGWARSSGDENGPPDDFADFAAFAGTLAERYAGRVAAYEIWSEPNLRREWNSNVHTIGAESYSNLLAAAYTAIKTADPSATVVSAGLAPTGFNDGINAINDRVFLTNLYANDLTTISDAVGAHPNGWANPPDSVCCDAPIGVETHFDDPTFFFLDTITDYRDIMVANNDGSTAIWVTAFGWGSSEDTTPPNETYVFVSYTSLAEQAIYAPRAYELGQELGYIGPMFLSNLNGCQAASASSETCFFSLVAPDGSPRPVFDAIANLDKTIQPTATPQPTTTAAPTSAPIVIQPDQPTLFAPTFTPNPVQGSTTAQEDASQNAVEVTVEPAVSVEVTTEAVDPVAEDTQDTTDNETFDDMGLIPTQEVLPPNATVEVE